MADEHNNDESKKTLVAFVVGLLIGGMLVWAFSEPSDSKDDNGNDTEITASTTDSSADADEDDAAPSFETGDADIEIDDQAAGDSVEISSATYPVEEGWIAVRDYQDDKEGYVLGAVRFSKRDGLNPMEITLQRPTVAGQKYAISLYKEDGDTDWGNDERIEGIFGTFTAE